MGQQISVEAALDAFRKEYGKVADENVLLKAHISELEAQLERTRATHQAAPEGTARDSSHLPGYEGVDSTE